MKILLGVFGGIAVLGLILGMWFMGTYNSIVRLDKDNELKWSQVETQYQRRFDLVPNLVNATKGTMAQEREVFGAIAEARTRYAGAKESGDANEQVEATQQYESALARLLVVMENYPELRSIEVVQGLMDELAGTENRVAYARNEFNESIRTYNVRVSVFPGSLVAGFFGFDEKALFESIEGAETVPTVNLEL